MLRYQRLILVVLVLSLFCCCDPGYQLHPVGWHASDTWKKQFRDFEIRTRGISGLIGESWVDPDLQVINNKNSISVESADLRTATESFSAEIYDTTDIPPSKSGYHIPVEWTFDPDRTAPKVLGEHCEIVLNLKVGGERREIKIQYER